MQIDLGRLPQELKEPAMEAGQRPSPAAPGEMVTALRDLLQAWSPRAICPQCGQHYDEWSCGPTHAIVKNLVWPP
jgi:hypothetical protein